MIIKQMTAGVLIGKVQDFRIFKKCKNFGTDIKKWLKWKVGRNKQTNKPVTLIKQYNAKCFQVALRENNRQVSVEGSGVMKVSGVSQGNGGGVMRGQF